MRTASLPAFSESLDTLHRHIIAVRGKRAIVKAATGVASSLALLAGAFTAEACLDILVDLPWIARALIFACTLAGSTCLLWRDTIRPLRKRMNDDAIGLMVEHALPVFRTRFIASIQLARTTNREKPHPLVSALVTETAETAANLNFGDVVGTRRMRRALLAAFAVFVVSATLLQFGNNKSLLLFKRAMLFNIPLPHKTNILSITGDKKIGVGEDFKLDVTATGVIPEYGQITATNASGDSHQFALGREPGRPGAFSAVIHSPQESFSYQVKLNDDTSQTYHVTTLRRPVVSNVLCEQIYPAYVNIPPVKRPVGDLTLLAGSKLKINARASMPVSKASLRLAGPGRELAMRINPRDQESLSGEIPIPLKGLTGFSIHLMSKDGVESGETATYRIDIVLDREPTVRIIYPARREVLATEKAKLMIAFEAKDDFGIASVDLHYRIDQGPENVVPFELGGINEKALTRHFDWDLGKIQPPVAEGTTIEFWIIVADNNNVTGPGRGTTEHYQAKIVSSDEKRIDLANRSQDIIGGVKVVAGSEQELNKTIGEVIFSKPK